MNTTLSLESLLYDALQQATGKELNPYRYSDSIWLTGHMVNHGDAAVFSHIPYHFVSDLDSETILAERFCVQVCWEEQIWTFAQGKVWRETKRIDDLKVITNMMNGWLSWLAEQELRLIVDRKVGFAHAKRLLKAIDTARNPE